VGEVAVTSNHHGVQLPTGGGDKRVDGGWLNRYLKCPDCGRREVPPGPD